MAGLFISGTDTGVGKTLVGCLLAQALSESGQRVGVMKPVETGVRENGPMDAMALARAAGGHSTPAQVCPYTFPLAATPSVAAAAVGAAIDLDLIVGTYRELARTAQTMLVEGAGGLLAPLTPELDMIDLALALELPVLLVARASLGTINHTRLSLGELHRRGAKLAGVVLSHTEGPLSAADQANLAPLVEGLGERLVGVIPPLAETPPSVPRPWFNLERLGLVESGGSEQRSNPFGLAAS
ncbi:MAG: dethiobiotin synthase [Myxococcota bacterium]|jgi:dethiobiotin synthetase|nr:dethiobiotin synthase [Myxococcota bacterium]